MKWLSQYKTPRRSPAGFEWVIIKKLPILFLTSVLLPLVIGSLIYIFFNSADLSLKMITAMVVGAIFFLWSFLLPLTIGVLIVYVMKGPAYVADGHSLPEHVMPLPIDKDQFFEE